ncbi:Metallophosphoesterase [Planctomycetales bacterium 10988]|nr:Metallophosphoesterase [Planctomycetales bacterium 10988]
MIGDIVGKPGRQIVSQAIPGLIQRESLDLVVANAENATHGSGLNPQNYQELMRAQIDGITMGDHIYRRRELKSILNRESNIVRPANYPPQAPGRDYAILSARNGVPVAIISLLGRVFMRPVDCPWRAVDRVLDRIPSSVNVILVDFHAEATSDKQIMGRYLDGKVTAVMGTHTHVPTADTQIFPGGTAFQADLGMTGPYESIIGRRIDRVTETTITFLPTEFEVATEDPRICGVLMDVDPTTGKTNSIERVCIYEEEAQDLATLYTSNHK